MTTAQVLVKGGPQDVTIAGIAKFGDADSPGGASFVLFTLDAAQELVAEPGKFDSILVVADDGLSQNEIVDRIAPELPAGTEAVTGEEITKESQDDLKQSLGFFNTFMLIFAVIALLVGAFIIFNTFFITIAQRTRENALLRALGAKQAPGARVGAARGACRRPDRLDRRDRRGHPRGIGTQGAARRVRLRAPCRAVSS